MSMQETQNRADSADAETLAFEKIDPPGEPYGVRVEGHGFERTYYVKVLPYFVKLEFTGMLGKIIDQALTGDGGISVGALLASLRDDADAEDADGVQSILRQFTDPDTMISAVIRLISIVPDRADDLYMVMLSVPKNERPLVKSILTGTPEEGGLTDEQGVTILERFIDLNGQAMRDFFVQHLARVARRVRDSMTGPASSSSSSTSAPSGASQ